MSEHTPDFTREVKGVSGSCSTGEKYAKEQIAAGTVPVLSCEGPCIRGEIARLAANLVAKDTAGLARACHAEAFFVPHSSMAAWVTGASKVVMVDGCFLRCHGRILENLVPRERIFHVDALPLHKKYMDVFLADDVPDDDRKAVAREVADKIRSSWNQTGPLA